MQIQVYDRFDDIPLTRDQWNELSGCNITNTIFQTHEWASAWWKTFGDRHELRCLAIADSAKITGLAPLMSSRTDPHDWHFLADGNSDYCDFTADGNRYTCLDTVIRHFAHDQTAWKSLSLRNLPERSTTLACLQTLCEKHGLWLHIGKRIAAPEIAFNEDHASYKLKYSVRRHCSRLERLGKLEFHVVRDIDELPGMLALLYSQHIARYRERGERSLFENQACRDFYETLARGLFDTGWLHFSRLSLDDIPLAVHFGFEYNRTLTWYKPAFDIAYGHYSPGTVLIKQLIDYARQNRLRILDFTIGDETFKSRFSNAVTYNRHAVIYRNRSSAYLRSFRDGAAWSVRRTMDLLRRPHASGKRHHPHA